MYPTYARSERIADGTMHAIGVIGAISGAVVLIVWAAGMSSAGQIAAIAIYGATLIATFTASAMYHMTPWEGLRPVLRRFDHAAIYLKIAGTYTPLVVMIGSAFAYVMLGIIWGLAVIGMVLKLFFWRSPGRFGPLLYLVMGWLSVLLVWKIWALFPVTITGLIVAGGLIYTLGVVFYVLPIRYGTAIWHGFVLAGSACFFAAIAIGAVTSGA